MGKHVVATVPAPGGQSPGRSEPWLGWQPGPWSRLARPRWAQGRRETAEQPLPSPTHPTRQTPGSNLPPPLWLVLGTAPGSFRAEGGACPHLSRPVPGCSSWPLQRAGHPLREALQAPPGFPGPQDYRPQRFRRHRATRPQSAPPGQTDARTERQPSPLSFRSCGWGPLTADRHWSPELGLHQASVPPGGPRLPGFSQLCRSPQHLRPELGRGSGTGSPRPWPPHSPPTGLAP